ncbi:MAG: PAS domain-containing protein [bacterium]|nr:PAS domain-containing protein [bacterium]
MAPKAKAAFAKAQAGELGYFEGLCPTLKGTPKWWEVTIVPLKNDRGEIDWILSMSRDVTELHNLRKENKRLISATK